MAGPCGPAMTSLMHRLRVRRFYLDVAWICETDFGCRIVELVLLGHKVMRRQRAAPVEQDSAPQLRHFLKLGHQLLLVLFARLGARCRDRDNNLWQSSPISDIRRALEDDPAETFECLPLGNDAVRPNREVRTCAAAVDF